MTSVNITTFHVFYVPKMAILNFHDLSMTFSIYVNILKERTKGNRAGYKVKYTLWWRQAIFHGTIWSLNIAHIFTNHHSHKMNQQPLSCLTKKGNETKMICQNITHFWRFSWWKGSASCYVFSVKQIVF